MTHDDSPNLITFLRADLLLPAPPEAVLDRARAFLQKVGYVPNPEEPLRFARKSAEHSASATSARALPCEVTLEAIADGTGSVLKLQFRLTGDGPALFGGDMRAQAGTRFPRYFKAERNALIAAAAGGPHASAAELGLLVHPAPVDNVPNAELSQVGAFLGFCAFGAYMLTHSLKESSFYLLLPLFMAVGGLVGRFVRNWRRAGTRATSAPFSARYLAAQAARIGNAVRHARGDAPPGPRRPARADPPTTTPDTWKGDVMVDASEQDVLFRAAAFLTCLGYASPALPPRVFVRGSSARDWGESHFRDASRIDQQPLFTYVPDPQIWQSRIDITAQPRNGRVQCLVLHRAEAITTLGQPTDAFVGPHAEYWHRERTALLAAVQGRPGPGADDLTAFASAIRLRKAGGEFAGILTATAFAAGGWFVAGSALAAGRINGVVLDVAVVALAGLGWKLSSVVLGERREQCVLTDDMSVIRAAWALADVAPTG